ncbi:MAG: undecaprenyl-phosphate glucose phosphotransferase [Sediminibacterium sp.]|nr:undecaprenyl-phosphate glucose phosphotransferase [Sediminibacterium sp.]MBX9780100.1 undecaprenyl-phosphate glucose phosphotransferase [Chitinophagaceae bacterium]
MTKNARYFNVTRYLADAFAIVLAYIVTLLISFSSFVTAFNISFLAFSIVFWYLLSQISKLYSDRRSNKFSEEIVFIVYNTLLLSITLSSSLYFLDVKKVYTIPFFFSYLGYIVLFVSLIKYILRKSIHAALHQGKLYDKILLVGSTPAAVNFYETINKFYYYGYECIGLIDEKPAKLNGCKYYGKIDALNTILKTEPVDEVVIALPHNEYHNIQRCMEVCDFHRTKVRILPDLQQYASASIAVENIGLLPTISVIELPLDKWQNKLLKRSFDIVFSLLVFFTVGLVLFPLISLLIKLTSKGTIFFKQERWGLNNEKITCYKFRTMVYNSKDVDDNGIYQQAQRNDPRITFIGKFLRQTNLDELPQFLNVLLGNMSVVGPRPHPTPLNIQSMHSVENYMLRHIVLPGISGWAQVNGCRGETRTPEDMQRRVNFDLYYIHRWTFWLDCQIILQTIINILRGDQNAY